MFLAIHESTTGRKAERGSSILTRCGAVLQTLVADQRAQSIVALIQCIDTILIVSTWLHRHLLH